MQQRKGYVSGAGIPKAPPPAKKIQPLSSPDWLLLWGKRTPLLVICFWSAVLTLVIIAHLAAPTAAETVVHCYQRFVLNAKLNIPLVPPGPAYADLLGFRICCAMPGGHMECPAGQDLECHVMRDEGPRLACYWMAPRLEGASCSIVYWSVAAAAAK